ncbi:MAG: hypothetical protein IPN42_13245 [Methylococcaceae bacterium]|nr:hypothetical protein [Methylococcaceae bacterium]
MNIYQSGDESEAESSRDRKKLLITGHPRCGSRYISLLLKHLGVDVNHEWFGANGICSWLYVVKDLNMPTLGSHIINPYASYATDFDYTLAYVRNPFDAIPSILLENWVERSYNFRRNHIIDQLGIDLDDYKSDLERAIASFLLWNKITQLKNPVETFKVENCVEAVHAFLVNNRLVHETIDISTIDIATNANSTSSRGIVKPEIPDDGYKRIADHLRTDLIAFCDQYGYDITVNL